MKKTTKLLPVNAAERPDWGFLSDVLGRRLTPPGDPAEAAAMLKAAMAEAFERDPEKLVMLACHPRKNRGKPQALDYFRQEMGMKEGLDFVTSRLLNARDDGAAPSVVRNPERGSSQNAIEYWDPTRCGVAPYIKARVGYIIQSYYSQKKETPLHTSLDQMAAQQIDIDTSGQVVRRMGVRHDDDAPDLTESDEQMPAAKIGDQDIDEDPLLVEGPEGLGYEDLLARIGHVQREISATEPGTPAAAKLRDALEDLNAAAGVLLKTEIAAQFANPGRRAAKLAPEKADTVERPEIAFFSQVMPAERAGFVAGGIPEQVRAKTLELLEHVRSVYEPDDYTATAEDVANEWDPSKETLFHRYPDIVSAGTDWAMNEEFVRRCAEELPILHATEAKKELEQMLLFGEPSAGEPSRASQHGAKDEAEVQESEVWTLRATPEVLLCSDTRADYHFFCKRLGVEPQRGLTGDALFAQVKELAQRWVMESAKFNKGLFLEVLKDYDPSKDGFFTEAVLEAMRDPSERPTPAKKRPADRVAAVLAEINACPDREDRDLPGSLF